jgi:hypothetical protein
MTKVLKAKKNTKAIRRLGELLRDVLDSFGWYGIGIAVAEEAPNAARSDSESQTEEEIHEEEIDEEDSEEPQYFFDPTDVQVAVDEAISSLMKEELIEDFSNPKDPPTLTQIVGVLFGEDSETKKKIEYFEELISGYEERAHIDELKEAYGILESFVEKISPKAAKK